jgi:hypothetical protein
VFDDFPLRFRDLGLLGLELNGDGQVAFLEPCDSNDKIDEQKKSFLFGGNLEN